MTPDEARLLAAATLRLAVVDMRRGDPHALAWLASTRAQLWLDILDISQSRLLTAVDWISHAHRAHQNGLPPAISSCILDTSDYLSRLPG